MFPLSKCVILGSVLLAALTDQASAQNTETLLCQLPAHTLSAAAVDGYPAAVQANAGSGADNLWGDFAELFGVDPQTLASAATGPLVRAEVFVNGEARQIVVATVDEAAAKEIVPDGIAEINDGQLLLADSEATLEAVSKLISGSEAAGPVGMSEILTREGEDATDTLTLTWYTAPWLEDQLTPEDQRSSEATKRLARAERHGYTAIQAIGGTVRLDGDKPVAADTLVFAHKPWASTLQMLAHLQPDDGLIVPPWVPADVGDVQVFNVDIPKAFKHVAVLFDDSFAEVAGTYEGTLEDVRNDLGVDLPKELYTILGPRLTIVTKPATKSSPAAFLCAFQTSNPQQAADVAEKLMKDDAEVKPTTVGDYPYTMWHVPPSEEGGLDFIFMVARGCFIYSDSATLLQQVLADQNGEGLSSDSQLEATRKAIIAGVDDQPSLLFVSGAGTSTSEKVDRPLGLLFSGFESPVGNSPRSDGGALFSSVLPRWSGFRVMVGWLEPNGLRLISQSGTEQ